jgi:hypothetical protein
MSSKQLRNQFKNLLKNTNKKAKKNTRNNKAKNKNKNINNKNLSQVLAQRLGANLGKTYLGSTHGAQLGSSIASYLSRISGMGAYRLSGNALAGPDVPAFRRDELGVRVAHREYIGDIIGTTAFANNVQLSLNPGVSATFPWLSQLATNFEQYKLHGCAFEYKTTSGTSIGSTNTALGTVIMATQYDVYDTPFTTKQQMENYQFGSSCVPFENMVHPIECKPSQTTVDKLYIRSGSISGDQRLYDLGLFQLATAGMQSGVTTIGELWVTYDVTLMKPKISSAAQLFGHWVESPEGSATAAHPFGTNDIAQPRVLNTLQSSIANFSAASTVVVQKIGGNQVIQFYRDGMYYIHAQWVGSNIAAVPTFTGSGSVTGLTVLRGQMQSSVAIYDVSAGGYSSHEAVWQVANTSGSVQNIAVTGNTSMTGATLDLFICYIGPLPGNTGV